MNLSVILSIFSLLILFSCAVSNDASGDEIPKEMKICHDFIDSALSESELDDFRATTEGDLIKYHFGLGTYLRNNLLRHHKRSDEIWEYFNDQGIFHLDDMSSLIIKSYHRHLNDKGADVDDQVKKYHEFWKPIADCEEKLNERAVALYERYTVGDTLRIQMPVSESSSVVDYPCPDDNREWEFNDSTDLEITGVIADKYHINSETNLFFNVRILTKSKADSKIMWKEKNVGDDVSVSLKTAWKIFMAD